MPQGGPGAEDGFCHAAGQGSWAPPGTCVLGGAAFGCLPISCNALPALIPSFLLIRVDLFFKVMLKVTFAGMLSAPNGSILVSKCAFFMLPVWLAAQPGSPWLAVCTSASPQTDSWGSGSAGGDVTHTQPVPVVSLLHPHHGSNWGGG